MLAKLKMIKEEMPRRMHQPIPTQGKWLWHVVNGYFTYHAVPTYAHALHVFRHHVIDLWRRMLRGRSQKDRMTWARMTQLIDDWLSKPTILHPWPSVRFAVTHPRWEPYAGKPPYCVSMGAIVENRADHYRRLARECLAMAPTFSTEARPVLIEMARLFARLAGAQDTAAPLEMADQAAVQQCGNVNATALRIDSI
jgi:hypothetical protein